ncbi:uncharacterized protein MELLADRAFT_90411 [Melampsora larici-populina 98AG31]|uniref:Uncharacterized protein n=1 Tax=Melampsora larici-populina (strain 98AG31 / pathotype 3-4-7) TaxID=747676 RepID=F4RWT9_MELLP|nr:uncharacterized protein MELLADRAFT_90411 [Melampsora larici-populina 98AG31]EGG03083.1 hypothetical protein MELLADRAFT_90411 [Melampsora larici-populina 98AG31]
MSCLTDQNPHLSSDLTTNTHHRLHLTAQMDEMDGINDNDEVVLFECNAEFQVFCKKGTTAKFTWKGFSNKHPILVEVIPTVTTYEVFKTNIIKACDQERAGIGAMILADSLAPTHPLGIKWTCWIATVPTYLKNKFHPLNDQADFDTWVKKVCDFPGKKAGVCMKMEKPISEAERAQEDNMLDQAVRGIPGADGQLLDRQLGDDDDAGEEDITIAKITSMDKTRYVLLTPDRVNRWARAIHDPAIHGQHFLELLLDNAMAL